MEENIRVDQNFANVVKPRPTETTVVETKSYRINY